MYFMSCMVFSAVVIWQNRFKIWDWTFWVGFEYLQKHTAMSLTDTLRQGRYWCSNSSRMWQLSSRYWTIDVQFFLRCHNYSQSIFSSFDPPNRTQSFQSTRPAILSLVVLSQPSTNALRLLAFISSPRSLISTIFAYIVQQTQSETGQVLMLTVVIDSRSHVQLGKWYGGPFSDRFGVAGWISGTLAELPHSFLILHSLSTTNHNSPPKYASHRCKSV